ncbi:MAG: hypothetical protein V2B20_13350 [Pseudomonadota bacterium]
MLKIFLSVIVSLVIVLLLVGCALPPIGQKDGTHYNSSELNEFKNKPLGTLLNYQQACYKLEDPEGDYALLSILKATVPTVAWNTLTGKGYDNLITNLSRLRTIYSKDYDPIPLDDFSGYCGDSIQVEYDKNDRKHWVYRNDVLIGTLKEDGFSHILPKKGTCHTWSPSIFNDPEHFSNPYLSFSKIFWVLTYGDSSLYFYTGLEGDLASWILSQPDRSVSLHSIFRQSYFLNTGDVYLSVLTIANIISRFWYYPDRERLCLARKLQIITEEQVGMGDNYGAWHHFWGLVLFGYCHSGWTAWLVGSIESFGSHMVSHIDEIDEDYINRHAGFVGADLKKCVEDIDNCRKN